MKLDTYLIAKDLSNSAFGRQIGVEGETVRRYRLGLRFPRPEIMPRISAATGDAVRSDDFYPNGRQDDSSLAKKRPVRAQRAREQSASA